MAECWFPAPWLKGRPIDAPDKIDLIDWYSQTDGYYPEAEEHDCKNSVLRFFRAQGSILYDDEFHSENTINHDDLQTTGRVNRVFRAMDMINKYKAAYEDGADLSKSVLVDFETVWYDHEGNVLPQKSMHNLQKVEDELKKRSPANSPVKAFWMGQELQRSEWDLARQNTDPLNQDHPTATDDHTNSVAPVYFYDYNLALPLYFPIKQKQRSANPFMADMPHDLLNQAQHFFGWFDQESQQPTTALNPTTAVFIPGSSNAPQLVQALEISTSPETGPMNSTGEPITQKTSTTVAEIIAQGKKEYNWGDRDDEYWPGDHIFIPIFCRPKQSWSKPQLLGRGYVAPKADPENQSKPTNEADVTPEPNNDIHDSGYASGPTQPSTNRYAAATNGNSTDDADGEISDNEAQHSEHTEDEDVRTYSVYPAAYRMLKYYQQCQSRDHEGRKRSVVLTWLDGIDEPKWTWGGRMRQH